ncbi:hypothetical protein CMI47_07280 [Candidatus Pacearchaeota archaeon]|jgi:hypothetical protein|nr:hypothetical protein [Candidatus Pacearchaeota archaeon]
MPTKYSDDIMYTRSSEKTVYIGQPPVSEGSDGDELWCFIEGDNSGLYHAKKFRGEWYFRLYSVEILGE